MLHVGGDWPSWRGDRVVLRWRKHAQDVRAGTAVTRRFHVIMQGLVDGMRTHRPEESSIAAHLLDIRDPETGVCMPLMHHVRYLFCRAWSASRMKHAARPRSAANLRLLQHQQNGSSLLRLWPADGSTLANEHAARDITAILASEYYAALEISQAAHVTCHCKDTQEKMQ